MNGQQRPTTGQDIAALVAAAIIISAWGFCLFLGWWVL